jgi:hypothetical protein
MNDLIEALQIFNKYGGKSHCLMELLTIQDVEENEVTEDEKARLIGLGFHWNFEYDCWASYRFGSA